MTPLSRLCLCWASREPCAALLSSKRTGVVAHVWLAMRDTSNKIDGLGESKRFSRVQVDLDKPDTLKHAIELSGATTAFVHTIFGSQDRMHGAFDALGGAGITYVALLPSYSVKGSAETEDVISHFIAGIRQKTEVALKESRIPFTPVRPALFTTNLSWYADDIRQGSGHLLDVKFDYISPLDIGTVYGALLGETHFRTGNNSIIPLYGPDLHT